ncbi:unnamed protein product [Rotaria sp. Silwood2]|nr:unnamed protein product [Rotaria sp. Silwood2]
MSCLDRHFNFNDVWIKVSEGLEHVYRTKEMLPTEYVEIYRVIYNYCTNTQPQSFGSEIPRKPTKNNRKNNVHDGANIIGEELYIKLRNYLKIYVEEIFEKGFDLQDESLLRFYATNWEDYRFSSKVINGFCHYLNRHWVRRMHDLGRRNVYEVFTMAMEVWQLVFFQPLQSQITLPCLQLINTERQNEIINTRLIRAVVQSYIELGFQENSSVSNNSHQITSPTLKIYKDYMEVPFLQYTEQFYRQEAANFLVHNSMSEYLRKIPRWIDEELHRIESYLHSSTSAPLIKILEQIFILDQLEAIYTEAKILLHNENYSDFAFLFKLVGRVPNTIVELKKIVEENFRPKAIESIEPINITAINAPTEYVKLILNIHNEFYKVAQIFFNNDEHFITAIDKTCRNFINNNVLTEATDNARKPAELLARYCDRLLRKGSEIERELDQIMIVFNYIKDKDVFEKFYGKMLGKRLVGKLSASNDYEESMILRLKNVCDLTYISKLQKLLEDDNVSKTLLDQYRKYCEKEKIDDIGINILN